MMQKLGEFLGHDHKEAEDVPPGVRYRCPNCEGLDLDGPFVRGQLLDILRADGPVEDTHYAMRGRDQYHVYYCPGCGQTMKLSDLKAEPYTLPK